MATRTCPNPQTCGVAEHVVGSDADTMCRSGGSTLTARQEQGRQMAGLSTEAMFAAVAIDERTELMAEAETLLKGIHSHDKMPEPLMEQIRSNWGANHDSYLDAADTAIRFGGLEDANVRHESWDAARGEIRLQEGTVSVDDIDEDYLLTETRTAYNTVQNVYDKSQVSISMNNDNPPVIDNPKLLDKANESHLRQYVEQSPSAEYYRRYLNEPDGMNEVREQMELDEHFSEHLTHDDFADFAKYEDAAGGAATALAQLSERIDRDIKQVFRDDCEHAQTDEAAFDSWYHNGTEIEWNAFNEDQIRQISEEMRTSSVPEPA